MSLTTRTAVKVPEITVFFWIVKLLTTAMGESTADFFVLNYNKYAAVIIGIIILAGVLALQFSVRRYVPWVYWLTVLMVAITGTMAADVLHIQFNVAYRSTSTLFAVILAVVFYAWWRTERTLSIHSIYTPRREAFYWAAVMSTFALGTALGDYTAATLNLGYLTSGIMFGAIFLVPALGYRFVRLNGVFAFWFAYVVTRPVGASFADYMGKSLFGGLGWGDGHVSFYLAIAFVVLVAYLQLSGIDGPKEKAPAV
jgi:uncharacterized membrane-anchored protein